MYIWETLVSYPQSLRIRYPEHAEMLDVLEQLQPPSGNDRYVAMSDFLNQGLKVGLLTMGEKERLRTVLGEVM